MKKSYLMTIIIGVMLSGCSLTEYTNIIRLRMLVSDMAPGILEISSDEKVEYMTNFYHGLVIEASKTVEEEGCNLSKIENSIDAGISDNNTRQLWKNFATEIHSEACVDGKLDKNKLDVFLEAYFESVDKKIEMFF